MRIEVRPARLQEEEQKREWRQRTEHHREQEKQQRLAEMAAAAAAAAGPQAEQHPTTQAFASKLRETLIKDLFADEEGGDGAGEGALEGATVLDLIGGDDVSSLQDVDQDLEQFQNHEVIRGILEQGRVLHEYARDVEEKLHQTEMESIQVCAPSSAGWTACCCAASVLSAWR